MSLRSSCGAEAKNKHPTQADFFWQSDIILDLLVSCVAKDQTHIRQMKAGRASRTIALTPAVIFGSLVTGRVGANPAPATIRTFLHRLVKKGVLKFETEGNRYVYRAAIRKSASVKNASKSFLESVFDGETGPLLTHFVKSHRLSTDEIEQLRSLLDEKG